MKSLVQYIKESMNIDRYYDEYGELKSNKFDLVKLKKGDTIYYFKDKKGFETIELKVSKVEVVNNTDKGAWPGIQYKCKVYVEKNEENIEYFFDYCSKRDHGFGGLFSSFMYILCVGVGYTDNKPEVDGNRITCRIAFDKDDIEFENGTLTPEVKAELQKRRGGGPERYINKTLRDEFNKYEGKKPDKTYNTTVGTLIKWMKQNSTPLTDWGCINDLVKYCFNDSMKEFRQYLKIIDKKEIELRQYSVSKSTPEVVLLTYLGDYPIAIDEADEDDDYTGMVSLETFLNKRSKK